MDPPQVAPTAKRGSSKRSTTGSKKGSKRSSKRSSRRSMPQRQKTSYSSQALAWLEPRLLLITTGVTLLGVFLQVVAISTDSWIILEAPTVVQGNTSGQFLVQAYTGLWRFCRVELVRNFNKEGTINEETVSSCKVHNHFSSEEEVLEEKGYDTEHHESEVKDMLQADYTRTAVSFTIIAMVIMTIGHAFAFYALRRPRYIIKRLAALLHFMTAACLLVLNEVFVKTVDHDSEGTPGGIPAGSVTHFGYSFVLSWLVFVFFVLAGLIFLFMSQKKKSEHADGSEAVADEPMEIFRR